MASRRPTSTVSRRRDRAPAGGGASAAMASRAAPATADGDRRRPAGRPADDVGDTLRGVVHDDAEVIAARRVLAREDDVAPYLRPRGDDDAAVAFAELLDLQRRRRRRARSRHVEAQGESRARSGAVVGIADRQSPASAGYQEGAVGIARRRRRRRRAGAQVRARAEAAVEQAFGGERIDRAAIGRRPRRLPRRLAVEPHAEPGEIRARRRHESLARARRVDVLDPQRQFPAEFAGRLLVAQRPIGVTEVQTAVRGRRESEADRNRSCHDV